MRRTFPFNLDAEIRKAVTYVLTELGKKAFPFDCGYFSASDIVKRVRSAAAEIAEDKEYGSLGLDGGWYSTVRIRTGGRDLLSEVRRVLFSMSELRADNPSGKRVSSGVRFRPADADLTEVEKRTKEERTKKRDRGTIYHLATKTGEWSWGPARCMENRKPSRSYRSYRNHVYKTDDPSKVTCKLCLAKLRPLGVQPRPDLDS